MQNVLKIKNMYFDEEKNWRNIFIWASLFHKDLCKHFHEPQGMTDVGLRK